MRRLELYEKADLLKHMVRDLLLGGDCEAVARRLSGEACREDIISYTCSLIENRVFDMSLTMEQHGQELPQAMRGIIGNLVARDQLEVPIEVTVKVNKVTFHLDLSDGLLVVNTLGGKRTDHTNRIWSTAGKKVEKPLMSTLCQLLKVPTQYFDQRKLPEYFREVDFYLVDGEKYHRCEVKLMGSGNTESADAAMARGAHILVADTLSQKTKTDLESKGILWVELRAKNGYQKFEQILETLNIPLTPFRGDLVAAVDEILQAIPDEDVAVQAQEISDPLTEVETRTSRRAAKKSPRKSK